MRTKRLFDNLRFKVGMGIMLPLVLILGLFSYLQYTRHRALEISLLEQSAANLGQVVEGSLRHAMLEQDSAVVQQMVDDVAEKGGVETVFLMNMQREVRYAPRRMEIGTSLSLSDPGCQDCHAPDKQTPEESKIVTLASGNRVARNCNPVENEPACAACHNPEIRLTGVIITDLSVAELEGNLAAGLRDTLLLFGGALIIGALTVNLAMHRVVVSRLARLAQAVKAFGQGDLSQRIARKGSDEIANLAEAFNQMAHGLQEKAALEQQVKKQADELRRLSEERGHLLEKTITAQEEERKRIARELHDEWAQTLAALTVNLDQAGKALPDEMVWHKQQLGRTHAVTVDALKKLRQLILDLRPAMLDDLGLVPAIRWYAETRLEANGTGLGFRASGSQRRLPPEIETALFRIAQEAINNIEKHADAEVATIRLDFQKDRVFMSFQDDGQGLEVERVLRSEGRDRGWGLLGMRERAVLLGGSLRIDSGPGHGTRIRVEVPLYRDGLIHG
jgi:signal transduction histidine kinase